MNDLYSFGECIRCHKTNVLKDKKCLGCNTENKINGLYGDLPDAFKDIFGSFNNRKEK